MNRINAKIIVIPILSLIFLIFASVIVLLIATKQKPLEPEFDADYYYTVSQQKFGNWTYEKLLSGYSYYLYLPPEAINNTDDESLKIPMIVTFHGSSSKGMNYARYGRMFLDNRIQDIKKCAVLVLNARGDYYYNLQDTSLVIENLLMRKRCLDKSNIIAFGHSQGAYFAARLAFYKPELFKAVISGSGYYIPTLWELIRARHVSFWWGNSQNDKGIYEQGHPAGKKIRLWCKNSVYAEYKSRGHFWVELNDEDPATGKKFIDWMKEEL